MPDISIENLKKISRNYARQIKFSITLSITVGFLILVERYIGWQSIFSSWQQLSIPVILIAVLFVLLSYAIRAIRIYTYFCLKGGNRYLLSFKLTLLHNFFNNVLPMRSGELSFPILLNQYFNIKTLDSVVALFLFRLLDLHVLLTLLIICAYVIFQEYLFLYILALLTWLAIPPVIFQYQKTVKNWIILKPSNKLFQLIVRCIESLPKNYEQLLCVYFWTICNWVCKLLIFAGILIQFYSMPFELSLVSVIFGDATSVLPIHGVAGAGTYEAGILLGASFFESNTKLLLTAAINLHLFILGVSAFGALISMVYYKPTNKLS